MRIIYRGGHLILPIRRVLLFYNIEIVRSTTYQTVHHPKDTTVYTLLLDTHTLCIVVHIL